MVGLALSLSALGQPREALAINNLGKACGETGQLHRALPPLLESMLEWLRH